MPLRGDIVRILRDREAGATLRSGAEALDRHGGARVVTSRNRLSELLAKRNGEIVKKWLELQASSGRKVSASEQQTSARQSGQLLTALTTAAQEGSVEDLSGPEWLRVRDIL